MSTFVKPEDDKPEDLQAAKETVDEAVNQIQAPKPERKKRYYSPGEVMKKKGCIGCGGMGIIAALAAVIIAVLAII
jgi:hypothetical protein